MTGIVLVWDEDKERWVLPHERGLILMPETCPRGKPCPEGFSDPAWCTLCVEDAEQKAKAAQVVATVELDDDDVEELREAVVTAEPSKKLITTTGPPSVGGQASVQATDTIAAAGGRVQRGNMIRNITTARYDTKCRSCNAQIEEGRTVIVGVKRNFYDNDPLRWLCQDCGLLYEQAYSQLINKPGGVNGAEESVSNGTVLLLFRWNDMTDQWVEARTRSASVQRYRP